MHLPPQRQPVARSDSHREGSVLFVTLAVLFLLMALGSLAFVRATIDLREAGFYAQDAQALYHAEAGVAFCIGHITNDFVNGAIWLETPVETVSYPPPTGFNFDPVTQLTRISNTRAYTFEVTGRAGDASSVLDVVIRADPGRPYTLQAGGPVLLLNASQGIGDIRSNDSIELDGPVTGDAMPGPGFSVLNAHHASGTTAAAPSSFGFEPIDADELAGVMTNNDNTNAAPHFSGGNYTVTGGTATLQPGTYYFENVVIDAGAVIDIPSGNVTMYVNGSLHVLNNSLLNSSGDPDRLNIISPSTGNMTLESSSLLFAHVYAPDLSNFWINDKSQSYGTLQVGGTLTLDDESLYEARGTAKLPSVELLWQRQRL